MSNPYTSSLAKLRGMQSNALGRSIHSIAMASLCIFHSSKSLNMLSAVSWYSELKTFVNWDNCWLFINNDSPNLN